MRSRSTGCLTELQGVCLLLCEGFGVAAAQVAEALLERGDLTKPDLLPGLSQSGFGVDGHVLDAAELGGVDPEEAASGVPLTELTW